MKIAGIGNDIIEIDRIERAIKRTALFRDKIYSPAEIEYAESKKNKYETYAGRFAAKEAVSKALGTGVREFSMKDIEILNDNLGRPYVVFGGELAKKYKNYSIMVSISHCKAYASASAIFIKN